MNIDKFKKQIKNISNWQYGFTLGVMFLIASGVVWSIPIIYDVAAIQTKDSLNLAYSNNIIITGVELNYLTHTKPHKITVHYSLHHLDNESGFVAFGFPYPGTLEKSLPEWQIRYFSDVNANVVYKKYSCTEESPCDSDSGDITFNVLGNLDSIRSFHHFIQIPFSSGATSKINSFHNELAGIPSFKQGWKINGSVKLELYLDKNKDLWNTQPTSELDTYLRASGVKHPILEWYINNSNILIAADYSGFQDRFNAEARPVLFAVLIGMGLTMIVANLQIKREDETLDILKGSIKNTEKRIKGVLKDMQSLWKNRKEHATYDLRTDLIVLKTLLERLKKILVDLKQENFNEFPSNKQIAMTAIRNLFYKNSVELYDKAVLSRDVLDPNIFPILHTFRAAWSDKSWHEFWGKNLANLNKLVDVDLAHIKTLEEDYCNDIKIDSEMEKHYQDAVKYHLELELQKVTKEFLGNDKS